MELEIREAVRNSEFRTVYELTYRVYVEDGYCEKREDRKLQHYSHLDEIPETTVIIGLHEGELVGTVSVTVDGPTGLHVDADFPEKMLEIRLGLHGRKLGASWRIITDRGFRHERVLALALMRAAFVAIINCGIDVLVCSFNPKHAGFYNRFLGFQTIANGTCKSVGDKAAVLMVYDVETNGVPVRLRNKP